jgi:photosystem II stability/assembly factor-like uncharacterized protein
VGTTTIERWPVARFAWRLLWLSMLAAPSPAQAIDPALLEAAKARALGPAAPGGRIVDVDVPAGRPFELWAASASGGVWKSTNNGTTWACVFDDALSIGDIAVAPSDPDVIWIGAGEGNNQRSSYAGNGVWRSSDGGKSFTHVGLSDSHHIGRIVVHPTDPETAWVAVLGHLYSPNDQRGLWKTTDGGATWELSLGRGPDVGIADVTVDPHDPDTLFAASYHRTRRAWNFADSGDSALYRSVDGGTSWRRLGGGLPAGNLGRIGVALFPGDPELVFACIDNQNLVEVPPAEGDPPRKEGEPPPMRAIGGEIWRSTDGGDTWEKRNEKPVSGEPPYYYGQIRVDPHDRDHVWLLGVPVFVSTDGGRTFSDERARSLHVDHHGLWFDPATRGRILLGNDGGLAQSYDGGATFDYYPNLPIAQFYTVSVDLRRPYHVYGGLQDNGVWTGPARGRGFGGVGSDAWKFIGGGDGMYVLADPEDPDLVYLESQFGALQRSHLSRGETAFIQPRGGKDEVDRFNWCSPLLISAHNPRTLYFGSQRLWKSLDRGDRWRAISGDLTGNDPEKVKGNVPHCTLTTLSESPLDPDSLLVGSDDGRVHWSRDGGHSWIDLSGRFPALPPNRWTSRVELSAHDHATAWVTFSGYREDDFAAWVYRTRDGGETFVRVVSGLPEAPVNVVRESPRRKDFLFLGNDGGAYFSVDGGDQWHPLASDLPQVSVLDLAVHPRERDVVLGTHGRGMFVVDVTAHEQIDDKVLAASHHLFEPASATAWRFRWSGGGMAWGGDRHFRAADPEAGAPIWFWLSAPAPAPKLEVVDAGGKVVRTVPFEAKSAGLQQVNWDLQLDPPPEEAKPAGATTPEGDGAVPPAGTKKSRGRRSFEPSPGEEAAFEDGYAQDAKRRRRGNRGNAAPPGRYLVRLTVGDQAMEKPILVEADGS